MPIWTDSMQNEICDGDPYTGADGTQYPESFPKSFIPGLSQVVEATPPGNPLFYTWAIQMVDGFPTQAWTALPLATIKANLLVALDTKEQQAEVTGTTRNGLAVNTDPATLARLVSASSALSAGMSSFPYLIGGIWVSIDNAMATSMLLTIGTHIHACLTNQQALHTAIEAATDISELQVIDITQGWPT